MADHNAHTYFGQEVMKRLPRDLRSHCTADLPAFHLGLYGPDPLIFSFQTKKTSDKLHKQWRNVSLPALSKALRHGDATQRSFAAGYLLHLLLDDTVTYLRVQLCFAPMAMLQLLFESFFVTAGRPGLGLGLATAAGVTNAVLDYLYMGPMQMGILGAALGTVTGYSIPAVAGVLFFLLRRQGLRFGRPHGDLRMLGRACFNGASEMVTNLSMAVTTFLFNAIMMAYLGEAGVSAITIVLYAQFLLVALYMGFSMGVAPVFSFNRGAGRYDRMRRIFGYCLRFILVSSVAILVVALALSGVVVGIFSTPGSPVYAIALDGFRRFAPAFLFAGVNIFSSALFTALSDGRTSAIISFARTFGFLLLGLLLLPRLLEVDGVWLAVPLAELLSCLLSVWFLRRKRADFGFGGGDLPRHRSEEHTSELQSHV